MNFSLPNRRSSLSAGLLLALCLLLKADFAVAEATTAAAEPSETSDHSELNNLLTQSKAHASARYRFEYVDQDGIQRAAKASTLRTRLGLTTGTAYELSGKLEFEDVSVIGNDTYNSTVNGETEYAVVADPEDTAVNEAFGAYGGVPDTAIRAGREALQIDNLRFIGDVGWRQNNQTFDGANISNDTIPDTRVWYGYVGRVNRIFGDDSDVGDFDTNLHLLNVRYSGFKPLTLIAYSYLFDVDDDDTLSTANFGLHAEGRSVVTDDVAMLYDLEYATQRDYENNPQDFSTYYLRGEFGAAISAVTFRAGYENLGSDNGEVGFSTPFATLHKWNGWADKFLVTPAAGLQDAYGGVRYGLKDVSDHVQKVTVDAVYHYFAADRGDQKFGDELDFEATIDFLRYVQCGVKYAHYDSAGFATDTEKLIFTIQATLTQ
ncbi:MAG: hypothetical protein KDD69_03380 [Bdellovibrionales bacterium]|nr:hypothetical protein [Bdellovibrionales bacterium]